MIFAYNKEHVGDVLMVILQETSPVKRHVERKGRVARVVSETGETLAWNIFEVSDLFPISGQGQIFLSEEALTCLNSELAREGFTETLEASQNPVFVVAEILEMQDHPDSDHLHICQVAIGQEAPVQIVCGAPNATVGLKTVAALPGAMMPSGSLIFPGQLRGVDSYGMLCSARELELPNAPQVRGIISLPDHAVVGEAFDAAKHWKG
ncbi:tRNA-binding protein [Streptococcus rupicaprae]|uniref:tRNA-binding protein n=1 Tax=Streptococcus rupicaprae TaxID=759619 RepID=A0ABV2FEB4_9STRE